MLKGQHVLWCSACSCSDAGHGCGRAVQDCDGWELGGNGSRLHARPQAAALGAMLRSCWLLATCTSSHSMLPALQSHTLFLPS